MKSLKEKNKLRQFSWKSISFKWTLLTALSITILFLSFGFVTYQISIRNVYEQEEKDFNRTMKEINSRLSRSEDPLTLHSTVSYLKEASSRYVGDVYYDRSSLEASLMNLNSFISELSQPELNVKIYGVDQRLVFETRGLYLPFDDSEQGKITIQTHNNITGLIALEPIKSNETGKVIGYAQGFLELNSFISVRDKMFKTLVVLEIVGVIISIIVGVLLSTYFTAPLRKMANSLNSINEAYKTEVRMPVPKSNDEISDLARAFNDMLERMQLFIQQQQQFVEDVSHELRTPVAVIEGHINLLNRWGKDDPEVLEESLQASLQEIVRMKSLVQEMLDLSRAEQSEFHYEDKVSSVVDVLKTTVGNFSMLYPDFHFNLDIDLAKSGQIKIYRNHLEQLLIILMDNAVKYSGERKEVLVSASSSYRTVDILVQDFGEGVSEEDLARIFSRFYRVDKARARHTGGNGLGLSIAAQLVNNYNGHISVKSVLNHGSSFKVSLPLVIEEPEEIAKTIKRT